MDTPSSGPGSGGRSFRLPGALGACLRPGAGPQRNPDVSGDCILLDFENRFFGVSDSSDRDPGASKRCLIRFDAMLSSLESTGGRQDIFNYEDGQHLGCLAEKTAKLLQEMMGQGTCTFTGIQLRTTTSGVAGVLMHTGDSSLYEYIPSASRLLPRTEKNFWMVGKTDRLYQISVVEFLSESILILMTDGIADLHDRSTLEPKEKIMAILRGTRVENLAMKMVARENPDSGLNDDAAVVTILPRNLETSRRKILLGN